MPFLSFRLTLSHPVRLGLVALLPLVSAASLSSCSSSSKPKKNTPASANYADMKMEQRFTYQIRNRDKVQTGLAKKAYTAGKEVKSGDYKTKEFNGGKIFRDKKFKTDSYAQADKKSGMLGKMFKGGDKANSMADDQFKSPLNRYGDKTPFDGDKRFSSESDSFAARPEPQILKKQQKPTRPVMLDDGQDPSYTEFDIQSLLKR